MSYNYLMLEVAPSKEISLAEAVDRLVGVDSSYCPYEIRLKAISRRAGLKKAVKVPILPRLIFVTASFPDLDALVALENCEGIVRNPYGQPEVIPGWEMQAFMAEVEIRRLARLKLASRSNQKTKAPKFVSFAALKAWFDSNNGGESLSEDGEILISAQAA